MDTTLGVMPLPHTIVLIAKESLELFLVLLTCTSQAIPRVVGRDTGNTCDRRPAIVLQHAAIAWCRAEPWGQLWKVVIQVKVVASKDAGWQMSGAITATVLRCGIF